MQFFIRGRCGNPVALAFGGVRGQSPLGEGVAALRQAQGPWDLWLAEESEGETSPIKIIFKKIVRAY